MSTRQQKENLARAKNLLVLAEKSGDYVAFRHFVIGTHRRTCQPQKFSSLSYVGEDIVKTILECYGDNIPSIIFMIFCFVVFDGLFDQYAEDGYSITVIKELMQWLNEYTLANCGHPVIQNFDIDHYESLIASTQKTNLSNLHLTQKPYEAGKVML